MPVSTQLIRNGEPVKLGWGWWHISVLADAMEKEGYPRVDPGNGKYIFMGFPNNGEYTFTEFHEYVDESDGEVFKIYPGDRYTAYR